MSAEYWKAILLKSPTEALSNLRGNLCNTIVGLSQIGTNKKLGLESEIEDSIKNKPLKPTSKNDHRFYDEKLKPR